MKYDGKISEVYKILDQFDKKKDKKKKKKEIGV